jgi:hypothetical protein
MPLSYGLWYSVPRPGGAKAERGVRKVRKNRETGTNYRDSGTEKRDNGTDKRDNGTENRDNGTNYRDDGTE